MSLPKIAPLAVLAGSAALLVPVAGSSGATKSCGSLVSDGVRYPVRVVEGDVACSDAVAALGAFLDGSAAPQGWVCARGHSGQPYAAQCATEPSGDVVVQAVNPPALSAPASVKRGATLSATGSGLKRGRYSLTLVADDQPARGVRCLAPIGRAKRTTGGWVTLSGRVPARLRCYQGASTFLGAIDTTAGAYHLVLGVRSGPAAWNADRTFLRRKLRVR